MTVNKSEANLTCQYCDRPEHYNLNEAREESSTGKSILWHYERMVYLRDAPRARVLCQKSLHRKVKSYEKVAAKYGYAGYGKFG